MLKIDVIKFEALDVITTSVACICDTDCYTGYGDGIYKLQSEHEEMCDCQAKNHINPYE